MEKEGEGARSAARKHEQNILKEIWPELVCTNHKFRPAVFLHASGSSHSLASPACSPFSEPAVHPAEGRPRVREGEEWKGKDSSAGWPWPLKKTEAERKTYCSLQSDHLRASLWVTHPGTHRPRGSGLGRAGNPREPGGCFGQTRNTWLEKGGPRGESVYGMWLGQLGRGRTEDNAVCELRAQLLGWPLAAV